MWYNDIHRWSNTALCKPQGGAGQLRGFERWALIAWRHTRLRFTSPRQAQYLLKNSQKLSKIPNQCLVAAQPAGRRRTHPSSLQAAAGIPTGVLNLSARADL